MQDSSARRNAAADAGLSEVDAMVRFHGANPAGNTASSDNDGADPLSTFNAADLRQLYDPNSA